MSDSMTTPHAQATAPTAPNTAPKTAVEFDNVSIIFGEKQNRHWPCSMKGQAVQMCARKPAKRSACTTARSPSPRGDPRSDGAIGLGEIDLAARGERPQSGRARAGAGVRRGRLGRCDQCPPRHPAADPAKARGNGVPAIRPPAWRSVRENVGLGLELAGMPAAERRTCVEDQLALVGLSNWADRKVSELSGGMQQRVGLARAFATDAPILLMDEPSPPSIR